MMSKRAITNVSLVLALSILASLGWLWGRNRIGLAESDRLEGHAYSVTLQLQKLLTLLTDAETGQRGFIITGTEGYLQPYNQALSQAARKLASLRSLTKGNPCQQQRLDAIELLVRAKLAELKETIELRRTKGFEAASQVVSAQLGKSLMDQLRQQLGEAQAEEARLLKQRTLAKEASIGTSFRTALIGGIFGCTLLLAAFLLLKREQAALCQANEQLEARVAQRTAELTRTNESLRANITERKAAQEALRDSEERFRTMANAMPQLAWTAQADGFITWYNYRWHKYTGTTLAQMQGWGWQSVHDPEVLPRVMERWKAAIASTQPFEMEFPLRGADGLFRQFLTRAFPMKDVEGRVLQWFGTNTDVDELKRSEEAQIRLAAIVEWSDDSILSNTLDRTIRTWNAGAERMFGYRAEEAVGQPVAMLIPPERADEENQLLERLKGGEAIKHCETVRVTKDRRRLEVSLTISPLNDSQGRVGGVSQIVRDIGELVRARQVLARSREDLERLVTERTAKLQETVAELEHFSYTITHDMRAPLRAMRGLGGILLEECSDCLHPARREYIRRIADSADRMDMLITDALQYSGAIRQHVELEPVDASAILRGILESYPAFQPPHANIHIDSSLPVVLGYTAGLTQCFSNLLGNAVKFVHPGQTPEVRIWAEVNFGEPQGKAQQEPDAQQTTGNFQGPLPPLIDHLSPAVDHVRIWFEDKGIGIEKEYHDKIWQMFQQLNKSYEGTGIGLALVRKVVDRMNGKVGVESEPGKGSRFWVELQRAGGPPLPPPHNDQLARYPLR